MTTIAKGHTLVFGGYSSETAPVGTGKIKFDFGTWSASGFSINTTRPTGEIDIDQSNNTLSGLRDAINAQNLQVTASILKTGDNSYSLMLKSIEGSANALRLSVTEAPDEAVYQTLIIQAITIPSRPLQLQMQHSKLTERQLQEQATQLQILLMV